MLQEVVGEKWPNKREFWITLFKQKEDLSLSSVLCITEWKI